MFNESMLHIDWYKRLGNNSLIAKHIHEWRSLDIPDNRPLPLVRQLAVDSSNQSHIDWNGTLKFWDDSRNLWYKIYSTDLEQIKAKNTDYVTIHNNANNCVNTLTHLVQYYYTNIPKNIKYTVIMPIDIVEKTTQIIIDAKKISEFLKPLIKK